MIIPSREQTQPFIACPTWKALEAHYHTMRHQHLRSLFANNPGRGERVSVEAAGTYFDYSKNRITDETIRLPVQLAGGCGLRGRLDALCGGETINVTETRAVLRTALRAAENERCVVVGVDVVPEVGGGMKP